MGRMGARRPREVKNPSPEEQQADDKADAAARLEMDLSD
jgi:hypothetical protein